MISYRSNKIFQALYDLLFNILMNFILTQHIECETRFKRCRFINETYERMRSGIKIHNETGLNDGHNKDSKLHLLKAGS